MTDVGVIFKPPLLTCMTLQLRRYKEVKVRLAGAPQTSPPPSPSLSGLPAWACTHAASGARLLTKLFHTPNVHVSEKSEVDRPRITFYNLASEAIKGHFLHLMFMRAMSIMPAVIQEEENYTPFLYGSSVKYFTDK